MLVNIIRLALENYDLRQENKQQKEQIEILIKSNASLCDELDKLNK